MNLGLIIQTYDGEIIFNALRFANNALKKGDEVKVFLMGAGVALENLNSEQFPITQLLDEFQSLQGVLLACETCLISRQMNDGVSNCDISTMDDCYEMVMWADKNLVF